MSAESSHDIPAPASLLARLNSDATAVAESGALLGDGSDLRHVAVLAGVDLATASRESANLVAADILRGADPVEFSHPVVRSAIFEGIDAQARDAMHRCAANILTEAGAPPEQAAAHLLQTQPAGDPEVVRALQSAADRALASGAYTTSIVYLSRALAEPPVDSERPGLLLALGLAERRADLPDAVTHLESAWRGDLEPSERARAGLELGRTLYFANRQGAAIDVLRGVAETLGEDDPDLRERVDAEIIGAARWGSDTYPIAAERLAALDEGALHGGGGSAQLLAALAIHGCVRCDSREVALRRALQALAMGVIHEVESIAFYHAVHVVFMGGEAEAACSVYEQALREARRRGNPFRVSNLLGFLANVRLRLGRLRDAEADLREGPELSQAVAAARRPSSGMPAPWRSS